MTLAVQEFYRKC
uniref:Uncharacterized protein n=1 Tax=Rhizophora mucronata TaxID=61149 RepID=A0A2P2P0G4_RHIMU